MTHSDHPDEHKSRKLRPRRLLLWLAAAVLGACILVTAGLWYFSHVPIRLPEYVSSFRPELHFQDVAAPGFDQQGQQRLADSAWSMRYFRADDSPIGYLYVGTDNDIVGLAAQGLRKGGMEKATRPPQIRRYRPDLGTQEWETVFDYADYEEPPYRNQGFRTMAVYKAKADGRTYLYVGTMADHNPTVWRTPSGDPGSWEQVFTFPNDPESKIGSVRGMVAHEDGLLYMSTTRSGDILPGGLGQIWATDGLTVTQVISDGFGDQGNVGVTNLASFNGCLYAGTYNPSHGYEVWKLRCVDDLQAPPVQVVSGGAGEAHDEAAMSLHVFDDHLYVGSGIPMGFNPFSGHGPRGCSLVRIGTADKWELLVGPERNQPLSGYGPGFGWHLNSYCWYMQDYEGYLYLGTWDMSRTIAYLGQDVDAVAPPFRPVLNQLVARPQDWSSPMGGDLYRSRDGVEWEPVFLNGLGNPDNHGIRTLEPTDMGMFVGTENPFTRLEVWLLPPSNASP